MLQPNKLPKYPNAKMYLYPSILHLRLIHHYRIHFTNLWLYEHQSIRQYYFLHKYLVPIEFVIRLHPCILCMDHMDSWSSLLLADEFFKFLLRINLWYNLLCKTFPNEFSSIYFLFQVPELRRKYKNQRQLFLFLYQGINRKEKV